jgi:transposase
MDVDKRSIVGLQVDHEGVEHGVRMPYEATTLLHYLEHHLAGQRVALVYEAGPTGFGLADDLLAAGYSCMIVNPAQVPTAKGKRVRTNRLDARKLAYQLRGGNLHGILVPGEMYRDLREYVTLRKLHMTEAAKGKQRIKALFLRHGLPWPGPAGGSWPKALVQQLTEYPCAPALQFKLQSLLASVLFSRGQALKAQQDMRRFVEATPELAESVRYAMSLPGIGWIVATYAVARLGDWRALGTSEQTASFMGLVQTEDSTGDTTKRGEITKAGDPILRSLMIEAAWTAIRKDPELSACYERIKATHAKDKASRIAIVAVARKLATRLHCVLQERRVYQVRA